MTNISISIEEGVKLVIDSTMLIWFIMEFRVFKRLLSNFIKFMQKKTSMNVDQVKKQVYRQNLFVRALSYNFPR